MGDPIEKEKVALAKLAEIFEEARAADFTGNAENAGNYENLENMSKANASAKANSKAKTKNNATNSENEPLSINPRNRKIQITFLANGITYKGIFDLTFENDVLQFRNACSVLSYYYGEEYPYRTRINANRQKTPCFSPRLEGPSADVLQILSTKIRLQVPDREGITIIDEAEKDGLFLSKAKLIRGLPSIYEKYGYVNAQIDYIKSKIPTLTASILSEDYKELLEEKSKLHIGDNTKIIDIMRRITPENEIIEGTEDDPVYISNIIYDVAHRYMYMQPFGSFIFKDANPDFHLVFDEDSDAWNAIKDKVLIIDVADVTELSKILFIQLPDNIREKIISIDDDADDGEPVLDILNRMKDKDVSLIENVYKYMENYLEKPLNASHKKYSNPNGGGKCGRQNKRKTKKRAKHRQGKKAKTFRK